MRVFELENEKRPISVVAGLTWHPLVPDNFKRELRPLATDLGADLYVYRKSNKSMVGFAKSEEGAKSGQIPIALIIAQGLEEESAPTNALVALEVPNSSSSSEATYIYVLIRDGFVLADGDQVGNEDQIRSRFLSDLSVSGWDLLIAPDHWKVKNSSSRELLSFLPKKGNKVKVPAAWKLRPITVSLKSAVVALIVISVLTGAGLVAFNFWKKAEAAKRQALIAAQQAAAEEAALKEKLSKEPWQDLPRAAVFMANCDTALKNVGVAAGNWTMGEFSCDGLTLSLKWERAGASALVSHLRAIFPNAVLSPDGAFATVTTKIPGSPVGAKTGEVLPAYGTRLDTLRDAKLRYGIAVTIQPKVAPPPNPSAPPTQVLVFPWTSFDITADSKLSYLTTVEALDAPGFRITKVDGKLKAGLINYQLKGIQYAKP